TRAMSDSSTRRAVRRREGSTRCACPVPSPASFHLLANSVVTPVRSPGRLNRLPRFVRHGNADPTTGVAATVRVLAFAWSLPAPPLTRRVERPACSAQAIDGRVGGGFAASLEA